MLGRKMRFDHIISGKGGNAESLLFSNGDNPSAYYYQAAWVSLDLLYNLLEDSNRHAFSSDMHALLTDEEVVEIGTFKPAMSRHDRFYQIFDQTNQDEREATTLSGLNGGNGDGSQSKPVDGIRRVFASPFTCAFASALLTESGMKHFNATNVAHRSGRLSSLCLRTIKAFVWGNMTHESFDPEGLKMAWQAWQNTQGSPMPQRVGTDISDKTGLISQSLTATRNLDLR